MFNKISKSLTVLTVIFGLAFGTVNVAQAKKAKMTCEEKANKKKDEKKRQKALQKCEKKAAKKSKKKSKKKKS